MDSINSKLSMIVDYYVLNMLEEPEIIRDALNSYFELSSNSEINATYQDLFGNLDRR